MLAMAMGPTHVSTGPQEPAKKEDPKDVIRRAFAETGIGEMQADGDPEMPFNIPDDYVKGIAGWDCDDGCVETAKRIKLPQDYKVSFLLITWVNESSSEKKVKPEDKGHWVLNINVDGTDYILDAVPGGGQVFERPKKPEAILEELFIDAYLPEPKKDDPRKSGKFGTRTFGANVDIYSQPGIDEPAPGTRSPENERRVQSALPKKAELNLKR